ncbi:MAG: hypothetical protein VYA75_02140, partial [SAR324 cluster bacterium]|nr:hypothetical protein [SAR324 cluster bacterium]
KLVSTNTGEISYPIHFLPLSNETLVVVVVSSVVVVVSSVLLFLAQEMTVKLKRNMEKMTG